MLRFFPAVFLLFGAAFAADPAPIVPDWTGAKDTLSSGVVPVLGILAVFLIIGIAAAAVAVISRAVSPRSED
jgi:hypothetical protein